MKKMVFIMGLIVMIIGVYIWLGPTPTVYINNVGYQPYAFIGVGMILASLPFTIYGWYAD
jgi:hypothetical protein